MPGDRNKSRERKLRRLQEQWSGEDWRIYKRCELCRRKFVVNNYEDKRPRTPRVLKRICCPWCQSANGKRRMVEHVAFERIADLPCLNNWGGDPADDDPDCKCIRCIANRVMLSDLKKELARERQ